MPTVEESAVTISGGETVYVKGNNPSGFSADFGRYSMFIISPNATGQTVSASGSVMSLIDDGLGTRSDIPDHSTFRTLFSGCPLSTAPKLSATELKMKCYEGMFSGCTSLTAAPALPATTLANSCYSSMFSGCTSLTAAPALPATTLAVQCCDHMFSGCTSLTAAPILPAATLVDYCYYGMFSGCTNLKSVVCHATNISADRCTSNWLMNVSSSGIFYTPLNREAWSAGDSGIPANWEMNMAFIDINSGSVKTIPTGWIKVDDNTYKKEFRFNDSWKSVILKDFGNPVKEGYVLGGWEPAPGSSDNLGTIQMVKAKWTTPSPEPTPTPSPEPTPASDTSSNVNLAIIIMSVTIAVGLIALAYFIRKMR